MVETFKSMGDNALRNSQVCLGEDASMGDMVSCASPGWNAYFPDATRDGIIEECVKERKYFRRQVIQSRPAIIVFSGDSALDMFMEAFPAEITPKIDEKTTTYERLKACLETPYWLNYTDGQEHFRSRIIFSPHFSYSDSFYAGCRLSESDWDHFDEIYPDDAKAVKNKTKTTYAGVLVEINPDEEPYRSSLSEDGRSFLSARYIDPIHAIADVMLQEYNENRIRLDTKGAHLARTDGPCRFCHNELFQIEPGCLYDT
jgi:hypothetical protein